MGKAACVTARVDIYCGCGLVLSECNASDECTMDLEELEYLLTHYSHTMSLLTQELTPHRKNSSMSIIMEFTSLVFHTILKHLVDREVAFWRLFSQYQQGGNTFQGWGMVP